MTIKEMRAQQPLDASAIRLAPPADDTPRIAIVVTGHVDHGKSTVMGRLLADTGSLPDGKLEQVRSLCERTARPFEYAFLLDALKDEQAQGITIDAARIFFNSSKRQYVILDAPGHIEFLKNMITGAGHAEAALLVIDALEGIQENSRRHGSMLALLGVSQIVVLVNKMDLVEFDEEVFAGISKKFFEFLNEVGIEPTCFIPVCGRDGDNIARPSDRMPWYSGPTVLQALDSFTTDRSAVERPFRMPVQSVFKFTADGDDRRIVAGTVLTGNVSVGDEIVFFPSGKRSHVKTIEAFNAGPTDAASAGDATGFTLREQIYIVRGEVAARAEDTKPHVTTRLRVSLFWLGSEPLVTGVDYTLKLGTTRVLAQVEEIQRVLNAATLASSESAAAIGKNEVAECILKLDRAIAFDVSADIAEMGRFVLVQDYEIRGGGIIREALPDRQSWARDRVLMRNYKWEPSGISLEERSERNAQQPRLVLITGDREADRKAVARELEARLFANGRLVYFLGIGNILYGVDADIGRAAEDRREHMRRLAEVANIMLDAGAILIVTAAELTGEDLEIIHGGVDPDRVTTVWLGEDTIDGVESDLKVGSQTESSEAVERIERHLKDQGVVFSAD